MEMPPTSEVDHEPMLSLPEAAAMLRCHPNTVRAWVRQGKLSPIPMGAEKVNMFLKADVERLKKPLERAGVIVKDDKYAFPVVGIGASAGGLDAITRLLQHLPTDLGLAYVFVTHQEKEQEKTLADVLRKKTAMPVLVVENGMKLDPDRLYVAPADMHTAVVNSTFTLQQPRGTSDTRIRPIDTFFTALANEYQNNAIGIVLSGGGMDGTEGLRSIQAEDGLTIVQDASAQDPSMPQSAQEADVVDLVRAPEDIARELVQLVKELFAGGKARIPSKHDNEMRRILQYLLEQRGVDFTEYKEATIHRRIIRRMVLSKCTKLSDYATLLRGTPTEVDTLCNDLLINVTSFFRDPAFHKALTEKVFPDLFAERTTIAPLRIWVAACAGGEEVVSIAITLLEFLGERAINTPVQIFATDLNERTIEKARLGVYKKSALQDMDPARVSKYFMHVDGHYQVIKPIRDLCVFAKHDLLKDPPFSRVDLISCQNMLIYLENTAQARVLKSFHYALKPVGYLALGKSETTSTAEGYFTQPDRDFKVHQKKRKGNQRLQSDLSFRSASVPVPPAVPPLSSLRPLSTNTDIDRAMEQVLLHRYVPASVLVNKDLEIVRFLGGTAPFLGPSSGRASLHLLKMVRDELAFDLRSLLQKARKEKIAVRKSGIPMQLNAGLMDVALEVVPMGDVRDPHYLVLFKEETRAPVPLPSNGSSAKATTTARDKRIAELEQELRETREQVRLICEEAELHTQELQAANEEVVSSNEELQSINEEMETSKEELQSINEEYATINEELRLRNDALQESEERLRLASRTGKVGLWDWDIVADRITWSDSLYEIHGVKKETFEANVKSFATLVHPDDHVRVKGAIDHAIKHDARYELEFRAVRPNGEVFWLFTTASVLRVDGRAIRLTGATLDITERKNAEAAITARSRALEVLNSVGDTLIAELDSERIAQSVTDAGVDLSGAIMGAFFYQTTDEHGEVTPRHTLAGIPPSAFKDPAKTTAAVRSSPTYRGEAALRIADVRTDARSAAYDPFQGLSKGHAAARSLIALPVTSRNGKVLGALFFGHPEPGRFTQETEDLLTALAAQTALAVDNADLHAALQRELEQQRLGAIALGESEKRYRQLMDTLPAAVFTCDAEGRVLLYNPAATELWGHAPDLSEGQWHGAHRMFNKDGEELTRQTSPIARTVKEGRSIREEVIIERPDGTRRHALVHPEPMRDASGQVIGGHNVLIDITERHHAEAERQQLSSMLQRSLNEIYIFDLKSLKFEYVNHGALGNLGYSLEQMRDMTPLDIKPEFDARQFDALVKPLRSGEKEKLLFHTVHRRADGTDYPVEVHLQIVDNGSKRSFMAMILDITERKLDEERLRVVTGTGKLGIWDWDIVADTITWTDPVYEIHGVVKGSFEPTMNGYAALIHPDDRESISKAIKSALEEGATYEVEFRTLNQKGVANWVYTSAVVLREGGRPVRMMGGTMNITQRKLAEEAARRLAAIVESSDDAILSRDLEGVITSWNKGAERIFGYAPEEIIGKSNHTLYPPDKKEEEEMLLDKVRNGERVEHYETVRLHKDGTPVEVSLTLSPLRNEKGEIIGASKVIRDITEDKRAREIIRLSEERFHLLADNVAQLIWMAEADGSTMWFNKRFEEFTGMSGEEIRLNAKDLHHPDHFDRVTGSLKARAEKGELWEETFPLKCKAGIYHWFLATAMPVRDADGKVVRWFGTLTDITKEREGQERLRASEERFRMLADNIGQLAWVAEPDGEIHWYNKRWFDYSGTTLEEMRGWGWQKIHHPDHVDRVTKKFKEHIQAEKDWEDTFPIRGADGEYHWFLSRAFPVRDENGKVLRWFGTNTDVTEERNAQLELVHSEERRRMLADNMSQMAYVADGQGRITWVNRRWVDFTGMNADEMNDGGWGRAVDPAHFDNMVTTYAKAQERGEPWEHIFRLRNTQGEYRWFLSRSVPIKNAEGQVERWFGTNTDITEQKLAEKALEESARHKDHFLATLAHELRNPLAPLKNGLQLLELAPDDPQTLETTRAMMVRQLDHMVRLVDDLMDLSRISRGKINLVQEAVSIAEVISTAMEATKPLIERNEHHLNVDVSTDGLVVHGDLARLTQVVSNLLNNAAKYTPRGGRIDLHVHREKEHAVIRVRDNGIGIDPAAIDRVFDMFAQVDPAQKHQSTGGLGIGLNVVQQLVRMHNGDVEGHSEGLGKGSEFIVRLPLVNVVEKPKPVELMGNTPTASRRVLVVDDNEDIALSTSLILKKTGHVVALAHDGEHAVSMADSFRPDVILMDIGMPKMNGYEACATIRATEHGKRIHIIAVSGWGQEEDRKKSQDAGFDGHVVKPMEKATLERVIAEAKPHVGA